MKTSEAQYHYAFGLHSRIPTCCIRFYVTEWHPFYENKWRGTAYDEQISAVHWGYVPCPDCFFGNTRAEIRICSIECVMNCMEEFKKEYMQ